MKKLSFLLSLSLFLLAVLPSSVNAAKKFVPKKKAAVKKSVSVITSGIPASVRYRGDKQGILMSLVNFNGIESISYSFTYETNGTTQGAGGTVRQDNNPTAQRELLFGTCSSGVCR